MTPELLEAFHFACESRQRVSGTARTVVDAFIDKVLDLAPGSSNGATEEDGSVLMRS